MIWFILILMFVLVIASTWWFGLWSNFITLVNLILSGLIATSFYQNLVAVLLGPMETYAVVLEFLSIWAVFVVSFLVLRGATDALSPIRLRFDKLTELIGRSLLSIAIAVVFICFVAFTMQLAPLPPDLFVAENSSFPALGKRDDATPEEIRENLRAESKALTNLVENQKYEEAIGPDKLWNSTVRLLSRASLSTPRSAGLFYGADTRELGRGDEAFDFQDVRVYDPIERFFIETAVKRRAVSRQEVLRIDTGNTTGD